MTGFGLYKILTLSHFSLFLSLPHISQRPIKPRAMECTMKGDGIFKRPEEGGGLLYQKG